MAEILIYNLGSRKAAGIKLLCSSIGVSCREVDRGDYGRPIGVLLGLSDSDICRPDSDFSEELLYFADIRGDLLDIILYQLRKRKLTVALKAVMTETNLGFTSYELYRELTAEREALQRGALAHEAKE